MVKQHLWLVLAMMPALLFACGPVTPVSQPAATIPADGVYPLTSRTGIEEIDRVLEVAANGDAQTLRALIKFTSTACTRAQGLGGPPKCRDGEAEGSPVEVLPIYGPEGHFVHKNEIEQWPGVDPEGLYAVYEVSPDFVPEADYPAGKYAIMLFDREDQSVVSLRVANGRIVRVDYLLDLSPAFLKGWIQREASKVILAPFQ